MRQHTNRFLAAAVIAMISFPATATVSPEVLDAPAVLVLLGIGIIAAVGIVRYMKR